MVEQHQRRRVEAGDLTGDLRSDPAAAAGDEHALSFEQLPDRLEVDVDGVTAEQVLDLEIPQVAQPRHPVDPRRRGADHANGNAGLGSDVGDLAQQLRRCLGDGEQHLVGVVVLDHPCEVGGAAGDGHLVHDAAPQGRVVIDHRDGHQPELGVVAQLAAAPPRRCHRPRRRRRARRARRGRRSAGRRTVVTGSARGRTGR